MVIQKTWQTNSATSTTSGGHPGRDQTLGGVLDGPAGAGRHGNLGCWSGPEQCFDAGQRLELPGGVAPNQMGWAGNAMNTADLDSLTVSGLYAHGTAVPSPVNNAQGYVLHMQHGNPDFAVQQWYQLNSATGQYMRIKAGVTGRAGCCSTASSTLSDWRASMHRTIHPAPSSSAAGLSVSTSMYATPTEPRSAGATPLPMWSHHGLPAGWYVVVLYHSGCLLVGFPVSFSRPPSVMVNPMRAAGNNASRPWGSTMSVTETLFSWYGYDTASVASGMAASYVAMGRWN